MTKYSVIIPTYQFVCVSNCFNYDKVIYVNVIPAICDFCSWFELHIEFSFIVSVYEFADVASLSR